VTAQSDPPHMATPRVAAGALFLDDAGRILLVKPTYKPYWDIPGGYVEPGESPRAACQREIQEELGLRITVGRHLVVDWAPAAGEGDKILFIFDGGSLTATGQARIVLNDGELCAWRYVDDEDLDEHSPARLVRRIRVAIEAKRNGHASYAEHGAEPTG
jgi:8-oxo-dGTP diphosphatase